MQTGILIQDPKHCPHYAALWIRVAELDGGDPTPAPAKKTRLRLPRKPDPTVQNNRLRPSRKTGSDRQEKNRIRPSRKKPDPTPKKNRSGREEKPDPTVKINRIRPQENLAADTLTVIKIRIQPYNTLLVNTHKWRKIWFLRNSDSGCSGRSPTFFKITIRIQILNPAMEKKAG